jgi:hypothetical protein
MTKIKFDKLKYPMRDYVMDSDIYDIDSEGYVTEDGARIDYDDLITQMVYAETITPEQGEAEEQKWKEISS